MIMLIPALPEANGAAGVSLICTNLPPECNEGIMGALFSQYVTTDCWTDRRYPGFSAAAPSSAPPPSSHPASNPGAKSFRITFASAEQASAAARETKGYLMQSGWEMGVSVA